MWAASSERPASTMPPQLFDVLLGNMPIFSSRYRVRPSFTRWAQINDYRGETDSLKVQKRVVYELEYISTKEVY